MSQAVVIKNAELFFTNFAGRVDNYNREGKRYFNVYLDDPEIAQQMIDDGWRVRIREPRNEGEVARSYIKVFVSYRFGAPEIYRRIGDVEYRMTEETVGQLDSDTILDALVQFHPAARNSAPDGLCSAYLDKLVVWVEEDEFDKTYRDIISGEG